SRTHTFQPDIVDEDDFHTYMWMEARQGWFLLTQRFVKGEAERWKVYREMIPRDSVNFFMRFTDVLPEYVQGNPAGG
ncbi:MAG TPA: hypothetical protein VGO93_10875, partial [Candidatus Xenobia bacterium]